jgi:hypothetical protein
MRVPTMQGGATCRAARLGRAARRRSPAPRGPGRPRRGGPGNDAEQPAAVPRPWPARPGSVTTTQTALASPAQRAPPICLHRPAPPPGTLHCGFPGPGARRQRRRRPRLGPAPKPSLRPAGIRTAARHGHAHACTPRPCYSMRTAARLGRLSPCSSEAGAAPARRRNRPPAHASAPRLRQPEGRRAGSGRAGPDRAGLDPVAVSPARTAPGQTAQGRTVPCPGGAGPAQQGLRPRGDSGNSVPAAASSSRSPAAHGFTLSLPGAAGA